MRKAPSLASPLKLNDRLAVLQFQRLGATWIYDTLNEGQQGIDDDLTDLRLSRSSSIMRCGSMIATLTSNCA